jgi:hypothetical protein
VTRTVSRVVWAASCSVFFVARPACAQTGKLVMELDGCVALSEPRLRELVELELETLRLSPDDSTLRVRCDADSAMIRLRRASGEWFPIEVRVELTETAEGARSRLVALAATELLAGAVRSDEREAVPATPTGAAVPTEPAPYPARESERASRRRASAPEHVALHASAIVAVMGAPSTTLSGGSLGAALVLGRTWSLLLDTGYTRGVTHTSPADVRWSSWTAFAGPLATYRAGPLLLGASLGLRGGWLTLHAIATRPDEGRRLGAPWLGIAVPLRAEAELVGPLRGLLSLEGGHVLSPVRGNDDAGRALTSHRGVWGMLGAGAVLGF